MDAGKSGMVWVKKVGANWKYWDTASSSWKSPPRAIGSYTVTSRVFKKSGSDYVIVEDPSFKWPEAFSEPTNLNSMKSKWLKLINKIWDKQFIVVHKACPSAKKKRCQWDLRIKVAWSE